MRVELPPSGARLQNIEGFVRKLKQPHVEDLRLVLPTSYFAVHPMVVAAVAAAGLRAQKAGNRVLINDIPDTPSVRYLDRMGLFEILGVSSGLAVRPREEAGRFIPLRKITAGKELSDFVVNLVPLFHANPQQASPLQYVISELVRNTLEHAGRDAPAIAAAQVFPKTNVIAIGVVDTGQGIRQSLKRSHRVGGDLEAIELAMRPGITSTTRRMGGTSDNAGAGLFFCKSLAYTSRNYFVMYSGSGLFKLLKAREDRIDRLHVDPGLDRATRHDDLPAWPGTAVGIDLDLNTFDEFTSFLQFIADAYHVDVRAKQSAHFKKRPRFI